MAIAPEVKRQGPSPRLFGDKRLACRKLGIVATTIRSIKHTGYWLLAVKRAFALAGVLRESLFIWLLLAICFPYAQLLKLVLF
jgi:hypothetical protein